MGVLSIVLYMNHSPPLYHAYVAMTLFLWTQIIGEYQFIKALWRYLCGRDLNYFLKLLATFAVSLIVLEFLVWFLKSLLQLCVFHSLLWCSTNANINEYMYLFWSLIIRFIASLIESSTPGVLFLWGSQLLVIFST